VLARIGALGDIHAEDESLVRALSFLRGQRLDAIVAYTLRWLTALTELQRDPDVALMLAGHTHERMVRKLEGLTAINAGTLHRDGAPGFLVVDLEARAVLAYDLRDGAIHPAERYPL